ncbi:MAG: hypothetical protein AB2A00_25570 [Myxococcota bacterium]
MTCDLQVPQGTGVTLNASPAGNSALEGWLAGCGTTGDPCTLTVDANHSVTVGFYLKNWLVPLGTASTEDPVQIAVDDNAGAIYVVGSTYGAPANETPSLGSDIFLAKLDRVERLLWFKRIILTGDQRATGVAVGPEGQIYVTGYSPGGDYAAQLARFEADGTETWVESVVQPNSYLRAKGVGVLSNGEIVMAGEGDANLEGCLYGTSQRVLVKVFNPQTRAVTREKCVQGTTAQYVFGVNVVADKILVSGYTQGSVVGSVGNFQGYADALLVRLDSQLNTTRAVIHSEPVYGADVFHGATEDGSGNLYAVGTVVVPDGQEYRDAFAVVKFSSAGAVLGRYALPSGTGGPQGRSVGITSTGRILASGTASSVNGMAGQFQDVVLLSLASDLTDPQFVVFDSTSVDQPGAMALSSDDEVFILGTFHSSVEGFSTLGQNDAYVIRYTADLQRR